MVSHSRQLRRRRLAEQRRVRRQAPNIRSWSEAPALWVDCTKPLRRAFTIGPKVASCAHLDGLESLDDLGELAVWAPVMTGTTLMCGSCFDEAFAERQRRADGQEGDPLCDGCLCPTPGMRTFTNTFDDPDGNLLVLGAYCAGCLQRAGVA